MKTRGSAAGVAVLCGFALAGAAAPAAVKSAPKAKAAARAYKVEAGKAGIEWVTIPGGSFIMEADNLGPNPRKKAHVETFQMARTLVTAGQFNKCVKAGVCVKPAIPSQGGDYPVVGVDWEQATIFSEWVGGRLPTEAEWEYAARSGGKDWKYPWGNEEATCERAVVLGCASGPAPVCSTPAGNTVHGLCDMAGNVWEWTRDWHRTGDLIDGSPWNTPAGYLRVIRGGSWYCRASVCDPQSAKSDINIAGVRGRGRDLGFRPAR